MTCERVTNQLVHEIGLRQSACLPEFGVHADRGETRQRVRFVDEYVLAAEEEVDPGHAFAAEKPKHLDRKLAETHRLLWRNIGGNTQIRSVGIDVFRLI